MSDLILHHYPSSPFAEKIRLVLGYKNLAWKSVVIPQIMPKPDVQALTGGYRKTPILQIGADIYCDTSLICDVLEHLAPTPSLYPEPGKGLARTLAQWADSTLFWPAMAYNLGPKGAADMFGNTPPEVAKAFSDDRRAMSGSMTRLRPADAAAAYKSYLRRLSDMLDDQPFLLGAVPPVADFACYHPLWFTRTRTPCTTPIRSTPSTQSQSATEFSHTRPPAPTPALLKTKCGAPKRAFTSAASCSIWAALDTSTLRASTWAPAASISACAASSASCCTSTSTRCMPRAAPIRAHSRPKPEPAPVSTAVFPTKSWIMLLPLPF